MDFMLRYQGSLSATSSAKEKQRLRRYFSTQLHQLATREPLFYAATSSDIPTARIVKGRPETERDADKKIKGYFYQLELNRVNYVPLVTRIHTLDCALDIVWIRNEKAGRPDSQDIFQRGGDLDNRLKNLLDALRMPQNKAEAVGAGDDRCFCLLEDDSLITRLSVSTHELLLPLDKKNLMDVELLIHVTVRSVYPQIGNVREGWAT